MNRDKIAKMPLVELLTFLSNQTHECFYKILSGVDGEQKRSRCKKMKCCYDCLSEWLNEGGRKMYIGKEWMEPCEVNALVGKLKAEKAESEEKLEKAKALLMQIRAYYSQTLSWEMYEEDVLALIGEGNNEDTAAR